MIRPAAYLMPVLLISACAPVPMTPERALRLCQEEEAGLADGVRGNVGVGVGSDGARARGSITVTNRVFNPTSSQDYIAQCVDDRLNGRGRPATIGITIGGST